LAAVVATLIAAPAPLDAQRFSAPQGHVENVSFEQIAGGVINIYYDLVSDATNAVFSIAVKASDDGGKTFTLQPSAITGDVANVAPGRRRKIVWRSGQDVAVLAFDQLKFDVVATSGQGTPKAEPAPAPAPAGAPPAGDNKLKYILPIAGGGAAAAAFLLLKKGDDKPAPLPCTFSVSPASLDFAFSGEAKTVTVSVTPAGCTPDSWTASSGAAFATVAPASGNGNGSVTITAAANSGAARNTTVTIAGKPVTVAQVGPTPCTAITASPNPISVPAAGGAQGPITVTLGPAGCAPATWTAAIGTNPGSFITNLNPTSGNSGQTFGFTATANTGAARTGSINLTGPTPGVTATVTVNQGITACTYTVTRTPAGNIAAGGASITVTLSASASTCAWTAAFNTNPTQTAAPGRMLTFANMSTNGTQASGTGNTPLMVTVAPLTTAGTRTGTVNFNDTASGNQNVANLTITQTNP